MEASMLPSFYIEFLTGFHMVYYGYFAMFGVKE